MFIIMYKKIESNNKIAKIFNFFNIFYLKLFLTSVNLFLHVRTLLND